MARILIADDAGFMRALLKKTLLEGGHEVVGEAENGRIAVSLFAATQPDLVMLDITMPEMDGLSALREIKDASASARVIMCTALGQENKVKEAIGFGASDYVVKPFTPAKLLDAISRALA
ncbi:MAG: response regulator [Armatimonadota bacterium]